MQKQLLNRFLHGLSWLVCLILKKLVLDKMIFSLYKRRQVEQRMLEILNSLSKGCGVGTGGERML